MMSMRGRVVLLVGIVGLLAQWASVSAANGRGDRGVEELGLLRWRFTTDAPVRAAPVAAAGMLYVGSTDGSLFALEADSGSQLWRFVTGAPIIAPVALTPEDVFVVDRQGRTHAVDRTSGRSRWHHTGGRELALPWGYEGWDYVGAAPVVAGDQLLVAGGDGLLRSLALEDGEVLWRFAAGARLRATPAVHEGVVYFGTGDGLFYAVSLADGREIWRFATDGNGMRSAHFGYDRQQINSGAVIADGVVYFGSRDANLYALRVADGEMLWKVNDGTSAWVIASPAVVGDRVFETRSSSTRVRALSAADGSELWSLTTGGAVFAAPVVVDDTVYVANGAGRLLALDASTGSERWRYGLGSGVWGAPLVHRGRLYVGSDDGSIYGFDRRDAPTPRLAVYRDDDLAPVSALGAAPAHVGVADYFRRRAYELLDGAALEVFLQERIGDGVGSVVVFAMDGLPESVTDGAERSLLRRYLNAGGKAVWLGQPPLLFTRDEEGQVTGVDRQLPSALLGVDHSPYLGDRYGVFPTGAGRLRGLSRSWIGGPTVAAIDTTAVLAVDELGRPVAWERNYGGPEGTGFVSLYPTSDAGRLDEIRAVAEYGIFRSPATRERDAH